MQVCYIWWEKGRRRKRENWDPQLRQSGKVESQGVEILKSENNVVSGWNWWMGKNKKWPKRYCFIPYNPFVVVFMHLLLTSVCIYKKARWVGSLGGKKPHLSCKEKGCYDGMVIKEGGRGMEKDG